MAFRSLLESKQSLLLFARTVASNFIQNNNFSSFTTGAVTTAGQSSTRWSNSMFIFKPNLNLLPRPSVIVPNCGIKVVGKPKPRCKHCYYCMLDGILHNLCDVYPRHKQRAFRKRQSYKYILTHACMSKIRPY